MRPSGSPKDLERRRLRALELLEEGRSPVEVARKLDVDRRSVRRWKAAVQKKGRRALKAKPAPGRPRRLLPRDRAKLVRALLKGARAAGYPTNLWTCPRVAHVIQDLFGVAYHVDHVCRLLRSLGFSPQKPTRRAVERDEDRIRGWVAKDWPAAKKKPAA